jgi:ADP-L-glycero-D-manno-heptose 6-epimerase
MLDSNYRCSKDLLDACQAQGTRLLYRLVGGHVSAAVARFAKSPISSSRFNVYGWSKLLFDNIVRRRCATITDAGGRLPLLQRVWPARAAQGADGVGGVPSLTSRLAQTGKVKLFGEYGGYGPGQQMRDFVYVGDVVAVNLWFLEHPDVSGIFNLGTGGRSLQRRCGRNRQQHAGQQGGAPLGLDELVSHGNIEYIPFPDALVGKYMSSRRPTCPAARGRLRHAFADVETGCVPTSTGFEVTLKRSHARLPR